MRLISAILALLLAALPVQSGMMVATLPDASILASGGAENVIVRVTPVLAAGCRGGFWLLATDSAEALGSELLTNYDWATGTGSGWDTSAVTEVTYDSPGITFAATVLNNMRQFTSLAGSLYQAEISVSAYTSGDLKFYRDGSNYDNLASAVGKSRYWYSGAALTRMSLLTNNFHGSVAYASVKAATAPETGIRVEINRTTGNLIVTKRINYVETILISTSMGTYNDANELAAIYENGQLWVFYAGEQIGTTQTISDTLGSNAFVTGDSGSFTGFSSSTLTLGGEILSGDDVDFSGGTIGNWTASLNGSGTLTYDGTNPDGEKVARLYSSSDSYLRGRLTTSYFTPAQNKFTRFSIRMYAAAANGEKTVRNYIYGFGSTVVVTDEADGVWVDLVAYKFIGADNVGDLRPGPSGDPDDGDIYYFDDVSVRQVQ